MTTTPQNSIRFNPGERFGSIARIDEVLSKGGHRDLMALFTTLMIDPHGAVAERVRQLCDARLNLRYDANPDYDLQVAARHLLLGFSNLIFRLPIDEYAPPDGPVPGCPRCNSQQIMVRDLGIGCEIRCFGAHCDWREVWSSYADWRANRLAHTTC